MECPACNCSHADVLIVYFLKDRMTVDTCRLLLHYPHLVLTLHHMTKLQVKFFCLCVCYLLLTSGIPCPGKRGPQQFDFSSEYGPWNRGSKTKVSDSDSSTSTSDVWLNTNELRDAGEVQGNSSWPFRVPKTTSKCIWKTKNIFQNCCVSTCFDFYLIISL